MPISTPYKLHRSMQVSYPIAKTTRLEHQICPFPGKVETVSNSVKCEKIAKTSDLESRA